MVSDNIPPVVPSSTDLMSGPGASLLRSQTVVSGAPVGGEHERHSVFSNISDFDQIALICVQETPGWMAFVESMPGYPLTDLVEVRQLMEGLSNQLFKVSLRIPNPETSPSQNGTVASRVPYSVVLFRVYGEHVSSFYDPVHELTVFRTLSMMSIAPRMIANGPQWRIEEFHESVVVSVSSLPNPSIFCQVASQLGRLHKIHTLARFPSEAFPNKSVAVAIERLDRWTEEAMAALPRLPQPEAVAATTGIQEILPEIPRMKALLLQEHKMNGSGFDIVFCHNDAQENNILLTPYGLRLIDFEYADFNFQLADIGNFFNEFTMDYLHPEAPFFKAMPEAYPSESARRMFAQVYLSEYLNRAVDASDELIDELLDAVEIGSQLSHLLWGMWSLVRAQQNTDTFTAFDFVQYAKFRFDQYRIKQAHLDDRTKAVIA